MMASERTVKRYSAYYAGWCVAFGEHRMSYDDSKDINWLIGDDRVGITLAPHLKRVLVRELLGKHVDIPQVTLAGGRIQINAAEYRFKQEEDLRGYDNFRQFFQNADEIHMFLTSHFCYPPGTRIITFAKKKPLLIMYKEIKPLRLTVE